MIIRRVEPMSCAKVGGMLYAILGLIFGVLFALVSSMGMMAALGRSGSTFGALFGVGSIILLPILYGVVGFVMTLIMAMVYNAASKFVGGIEIEVE